MRKSCGTICNGMWLAIACCSLLGACADKNTDQSRPSDSSPKGLQERLSGGGGYKQDANGQWVPNSDKRSSFDGQQESPYFKGKMDKKEYSTGDYAEKKSWWGSKDYGTKEYGGTSESRFQSTKARQDGMTARDDGKGARESGTFKTNTNRLDGKTARETGACSIARPLDAAVETRRKTYKAPSVTEWQEQRSMSMEQSKGILGRLSD